MTEIKDFMGKAENFVRKLKDYLNKWIEDKEQA
jgi:hypothetical protein